MTCKTEGTSERAQVAQRGHKAQVGHKLKDAACALVNLCFSFLFLIKGTRAQVKEGGAVESEKGGKKAQKGEKQVKCKNTGAIWNNLCPCAFAIIAGGAA